VRNSCTTTAVALCSGRPGSHRDSMVAEMVRWRQSCNARMLGGISQ